MRLDEFVNRYVNTKVDFDGAYGAQCFLKDHCVLMSDWTYKPIQDLRVGDKVVGYNNDVNEITKLFKSEREVIHIKTELSDIYVTPEHPFYTKDGIFVSASDIANHKPALFDKENYVPSGLSDDELLFLGFWLGDGNIGKHSDGRTDEIRVTYGSNKADFVRSLKVTSAERPHHECENAFVGSVRKREHELLTGIILNLCAGEYKRLPLIFTNREYKLILRGLIHADGSPKNGSYVITNTSLPLLMSVQAMCLKLGYKTKSIRLSGRKDGGIKINGKTVKSVKPLYRLTVAESNQKATHDYTKIMERFKAEVYNIETDGTHTYICNNYKVHNCVDLFRQYCKDVLEIPHTGAVEGAKNLYLDYNSLPLERKYFEAVPTRLPQYGDAVIWGATKSNPYGHVAIALAVNVKGSVLVFEQDGYKQDGAKVKERSADGVIGVLRARGSANGL